VGGVHFIEEDCRARSKWIPDRVRYRAQVRDDATLRRVGSARAALGEQRRVARAWRANRYTATSAVAAPGSGEKAVHDPALRCGDHAMLEGGANASLRTLLHG
jgi:hypothetical protein